MSAVRARAGSPLRFLALVIMAWTAGRAAMLWTATGAAPGMSGDLASAIVTGRQAARTDPASGAPSPAARSAQTPAPMALARAFSAPLPSFSAPLLLRRSPAAVTDPDRIALALMGLVRFGPPLAPPAPLSFDYAIVNMPSARQLAVVANPDGAAAPEPKRGSRWSASFWTIARDGDGRGASLGGSQLGGGQSGGRIAYALGRQRRWSLVARSAAPIAGPGREASIGIEWQPTRLPIRLTAEDRVSLDYGGHAPALGVNGGIGAVPVWRGFRFEAYGQAGAIWRGGLSGFVDGSARIDRRIASYRRVDVDVGAGAWGAAQPGAARLDAGPALSLSFPVKQRHIRMEIDWRQRLAGAARPGSGGAITIAGDL